MSRRSSIRSALAVLLALGVGTSLAVAATPAGADPSPTSFTVTVNGGSSASILSTDNATLDVSGLPLDATGSIEYDQGGSALCTADLSVGTSCTTSGLTAGDYTGITATYSGDDTYAGSTSTNSVDLTVTDPLTSTSFTVTVNGGSSASILSTDNATLDVSGLPLDATGSIEFDQAGSALCTADLSVGTSCTTSGLTAGDYTGITATYSGDDTYAGSTSTNSVDLTVTDPLTPTSFTINVDGGSSETIPTTTDATLDVSGLPDDATGSIEYSQGGSALCTADLSVGTSCTTSGLTAGSYTGITATYSGDDTYAGSTSTNSVGLTVGNVNLTCTRMAGRTTTKVQIAKCGFAGKGVWIAGDSVFTGATGTWAIGGATFTYTATDDIVGSGSCGSSRTEHDVTGVVTASTSSRVAVGDYVGFQACVNSTSHVVKLVPGSTASL